jgi:hypothetical protein
MLITVGLPWWANGMLGRTEEVYLVNPKQTELDGEVVTDGVAQCITGGQSVKLPGYIKLESVAGYIQATLGADHRVESDARLN